MLQRARASGVDVHSKLHNNQAFGKGDFISAYRFPKADWHILVAMVFHFVEHHILSQRIYSGNQMHKQLNAITGLETMILTKPGEKSRSCKYSITSSLHIHHVSNSGLPQTRTTLRSGPRGQFQLYLRPQSPPKTIFPTKSQIA